MILLMLRDGSIAEIPQGHDIIHRRQELMCIDRSGEVITSLDPKEVLAYTCSEAAARRFVNDVEEQENALHNADEAEEQNARAAPANGEHANGHGKSHEASYVQGGSHAAEYARH